MRKILLEKLQKSRRKQFLFFAHAWTQGYRLKLNYVSYREGASIVGYISNDTKLKGNNAELNNIGIILFIGYHFLHFKA